MKYKSSYYVYRLKWRFFLWIQKVLKIKYYHDTIDIRDYQVKIIQSVREFEPFGDDEKRFEYERNRVLQDLLKEMVDGKFIALEVSVTKRPPKQFTRIKAKIYCMQL